MKTNNKSLHLLKLFKYIIDIFKYKIVLTMV
jgi:hypothetical protein